MAMKRNTWARWIGAVRARLGDSRLDVRHAHDAWTRGIGADRYCNLIYYREREERERRQVAAYVAEGLGEI
jgi:hypothetical protein